MRKRNHPPRGTALTLALAGVLFTAAAGSTGCTPAQKRGALIGAAVGTGVGLIIASEARHRRQARYDRRPAYDHRFDDTTTRRNNKRRSRSCK